MSLALSGTKLFAATSGSGVFLSTDTGANWTPANSGLTNTDVNSLFTQGSNLFAGTTNGVFLSTDNGANWTEAGLSGTYPYLVHVLSLTISGSNLFAATMYSGVWRRPMSELVRTIDHQLPPLWQSTGLSIHSRFILATM